MSLFCFSTYFAKKVSTDFLLFVNCVSAVCLCSTLLPLYIFYLSCHRKLLETPWWIKCFLIRIRYILGQKPAWKMKLFLLNLSIIPTTEVEYSTFMLLHILHFLNTIGLLQVKTFAANFQFYQNLGKLTRKCCTKYSLKFFPLMLDLDLDLDLTSLIRPVLDLYHNSLGPEKEIVSGNLSPTNLVTSSICVGCWNR